jgi:hypothetical protein
MAHLITVGGLPYNLHDVNDQIKLLKIAKTTWGVVPEWVVNYLSAPETEILNKPVELFSAEDTHDRH